MRPTFLVDELPSAEVLSDMLLLVGSYVSSSTLEKLAPLEALVVADWAVREHLRASDNALQHRPKPLILECCQDEFTLACRICGDPEKPIAFATPRDRGQWAADHQAMTGHDRWAIEDKPATIRPMPRAQF